MKKIIENLKYKISDVEENNSKVVFLKISNMILIM